MRILLLAGLLGSAAVAQSLTEPPPIVQLVRRPGTGGASLKAYASAGAAINVIGMASVTGLPETWLVESHYSFASVEPWISYVSSDFADVDPEFWRGKVQ